MMESTTAVSSSPRKMDTMAGGASEAPRRWSLPAEATVLRRKSWYSSTPLINADRKTRNWAFWLGVLPGLNRFFPESVLRDQLLCLPEPFTPAKGFSWSRHTRLCLAAHFFITCIANWLASQALLALL